MKHTFHGYVVGQRVAAVLRQLTDVVTSAPHAVAALCLDDNGYTLLAVSLVKSTYNVIAHLFTQAVEPLWVLHFYKTHTVVDADADQTILLLFHNRNYQFSILNSLHSHHSLYQPHNDRYGNGKDTDDVDNNARLHHLRDRHHTRGIDNGIGRCGDRHHEA